MPPPPGRSTENRKPFIVKTNLLAINVGNTRCHLGAYRAGQLAAEAQLALDCDADGNLWASTGQYGISHLSTTGRWTAYTKIRIDTGDDDALSYYINNLALLYDSRGFLWCNSLDYDLDRVLNDRFWVIKPFSHKPFASNYAPNP